MKILKNKILKSIIIIPVIIMVLLCTCVPTKVYATKSQDNIIENFFDRVTSSIKGVVGYSTSTSGQTSWGVDNMLGNLLKELLYLIIGLGDVCVSLLQVVMIGDADFWVSTMISNKNDNLDNPDSWLYADQTDVDALSSGGQSSRGNVLIVMEEKALRNGILGLNDTWQVPNILYTPEAIFSNKIAALDANFMNPGEYQPVSQSREAQNESVSFAKVITPTIASWYRAFRNLAIVALLTILVYTGIRIVIGSSAGEKAKYKERIQDWFVALCLVFFMHFIMAAIMMFTESIISLFEGAANSGIIVAINDGCIFRTNLTGYIRFVAQADLWTECAGYTVMYAIIIGITVKYTWIYLRRFMYLAFFTMIAPLVAATYPLDKMADGKAQAYNKWFKEYVTLALTQPMHLILYSALVSSATTLCVKNPIYAIAVMIFISTAEKWVKNLFRMDEAKLTSTTLGDVAMLHAIGKSLGGGAKAIGGFAVKGLAKGAAAAATIFTGGAGAPAAAGLGAAAGGLGEAAGAAGVGAGESSEGAAEERLGEAARKLGESSGRLRESSGRLGESSGRLGESSGELGEAAMEEINSSTDSNDVNDALNVSSPSIRDRLIGNSSIDNNSNTETFEGDAIYRDENAISTTHIEMVDNNVIDENENEDTNNLLDESYFSDSNTQNAQNSQNTQNLSNNTEAPNATIPNGQTSQDFANTIAQALKLALDQKDNEKEQKDKQEKERKEFVAKSMEDSIKAKLAKGVLKTGVSVAGGLAGTMIGLGVAAFRGEDYGKAALTGALGVSGALNGAVFGSENEKGIFDGGMDVLRERKRRYLEALANAIPEDDIQDEEKARVMRKVASMAARNDNSKPIVDANGKKQKQNWTEQRAFVTYSYATSPQFKNMATDHAAADRLERYMRDSMGATREQIEQTKKDIIEAQKTPIKIRGRR